jgi:hypothetical protein
MLASALGYPACRQLILFASQNFLQEEIFSGQKSAYNPDFWVICR